MAGQEPWTVADGFLKPFGEMLFDAGKRLLVGEEVTSDSLWLAYGRLNFDVALVLLQTSVSVEFSDRVRDRIEGVLKQFGELEDAAQKRFRIADERNVLGNAIQIESLHYPGPASTGTKTPTGYAVRIKNPGRMLWEVDSLANELMVIGHFLRTAAVAVRHQVPNLDAAELVEVGVVMVGGESDPDDNRWPCTLQAPYAYRNHGPVSGTKKELVAAVLGKDDPRLLDGWIDSGAAYGCKVHRTMYLMWFKTQEEYARVNGILIAKRAKSPLE